VFGDDRLIQSVEANREHPPVKLLGRVMDDVKAFVGSAVQSDDMTMLVLRYASPLVQL
jgi:serine phosphatase RsbU (regulator of sigma subunit)